MGREVSVLAFFARGFSSPALSLSVSLFATAIVVVVVVVVVELQFWRLLGAEALAAVQFCTVQRASHEVLLGVLGGFLGEIVDHGAFAPSATSAGGGCFRGLSMVVVMPAKACRSSDESALAMEGSPSTQVQVTYWKGKTA